MDDSITQINKYIEEVKNEHNDYLFIVFSGHGAYSKKKECRMLEIGEDILYESELLYLSEKQTTILDTCAGVYDDLLEEMSTESLKAESTFRSVAIDYRLLFDEEISKAPKQQNILYSSSIDENSQDDTELGGYFIYELLRSADENEESIWSIKAAFNLAEKNVKKRTKNDQNPQMKSPKLKDGYLPFSIKRY